MSSGASELKYLIDENMTFEMTHAEVINQLLGSTVEHINHAEGRKGKAFRFCLLINKYTVCVWLCFTRLIIITIACKNTLFSQCV